MIGALTITLIALKLVGVEPFNEWPWFATVAPFCLSILLTVFED